jgi:nicotinate-nucleotide adenylyltransferase
LLLGADSLEHLLSWSRLDQLFSLADFLFVPRPGFGATTLSRFRKGLDSATKHSFQANMLDMPEVDVSSTLIRERLANGQSIDGYLPVTVAKAIKSARAYTKP